MTRTAPFDTALARVLGLRFKQVPRDPCSFEMLAQDWRLYDRALNPASKVPCVTSSIAATNTCESGE